MKLFNEGKLVRYLGYAIGEIALIIIGIMMALQLNNWNEDRKAHAEFDLYVLQLKEDVREAIEEVNQNKAQMEEFLLAIRFIPEFLILHNPGTDGLITFEKGLNAIGKYPEIQVSIGLLGQLMNGDMTIISRDQALARGAMKLENSLEQQLKVLEHVGDQIDLAANNINRYIMRN